MTRYRDNWLEMAAQIADQRAAISWANAKEWADREGGDSLAAATERTAAKEAKLIAHLIRVKKGE